MLPEQPPPDELPRPHTEQARGWMARLAFSFLVLGGAAGYEAWRADHAGLEKRAMLLYACAVLGIVLGFAGIRARHRSH